MDQNQYCRINNLLDFKLQPKQTIRFVTHLVVASSCTSAWSRGSRWRSRSGWGLRWASFRLLFTFRQKLWNSQNLKLKLFTYLRWRTKSRRSLLIEFRASNLQLKSSNWKLWVINISRAPVGFTVKLLLTHRTRFDRTECLPVTSTTASASGAVLYRMDQE